MSAPPPGGECVAARFRQVRAASEALADPLSAEDMGAQSMPDASPTKWHLAHTTWFFATFLLGNSPLPWAHLYNSYYETVGDIYPRPRRGLLTRPSLHEVLAWRREVTGRVGALLERADAAAWADLAPLLALGIAHEEQHQELILTDILHLFAQNPLCPAYGALHHAEASSAPPLRWLDFPGGVVEIGHDGSGFAFDNEAPRHAVLLRPWRLASRLVTNEEYLAFIADGGYVRPELWLSDGWAMVRGEGWRAPLYWRDWDGRHFTMTLAGRRPLEPAAPVCHVSYYEADAYARWAGKRLPLETEWEQAAVGVPVRGNVFGGPLRPLVAEDDTATGPRQMFGDAWEWTMSPYMPYPGYRPSAGALGEYNGKFMISQMVLRGGSCVTPPGHLRPTYRNFFPPAARWQFTGIRLAEDA